MSGPYRLGQYRTFRGDKWLRMGPGARRLARAYLWVRLHQAAADQGLRLIGEPRESTEYDEVRRGVLLCCEARAVPVNPGEPPPAPPWRRAD